MHLIKITLLASLASVALGRCVKSAGDCPSGTHAEVEPEICRDEGYPPSYPLLCVGDNVNARLGSLSRWFPRGSSRQAPLREFMCAFPGDDCNFPNECCTGSCNAFSECD